MSKKIIESIEKLVSEDLTTDLCIYLYRCKIQTSKKEAKKIYNMLVILQEKGVLRLLEE